MRPSIFRYSNYITYFQDAYEHRHAVDRTFSFEQIAEKGGLKSRTAVRNILKAASKPKREELFGMATAFELNDTERKYLQCLYDFEHSERSQVAYDLFQKLIRIQAQEHPAEILPFKELEVAASLLHLSVLTILDLPSAPTTPEGVTVLLKNRYELNAVEQAIRDLGSLSYISPHPDRSGWIVREKHLKRIHMNADFFLARFHEECLTAAQTSLKEETPADRYLVGVNFGISARIFPRVIQKVNAFMENLMRMEGEAGPADTVLQVNLQALQLTTPWVLAIRTTREKRRVSIVNH